MAGLILNNIKKSYGKTDIIKGVNLEIRDKEFLVLVGASGCGKSTILRMIAGLEDITDGELFIDNKKVNNVSPKDRDIAFVFQSYALYPHMSVKDNISFGLKMRNVPKDIIEKKVEEASKMLNLEGLLNRKPKELSGGQRQRVALGRAIVREPKVFLMDEPLSNLDAKLRVQMRSEIKKLHNKLQTTFIYVTHDQTEALTMGDRIVVLDKGVIQQVDTPDNIYKNPSNMFVAGFIGSPQINFIPVEFLPIRARENVIAGIRPEAFSISGGQYQINVSVDMVEMLGSEKIVYFYIDKIKCSVKLPSNFDVTDSLTLYFNDENILYFDKLTGNRIYKLD
jgi:multiple sugar transport system ATP-binding protein